MLNDNNLWCEDCERSNAGECSEHGPLVVVSDIPVQSRARQSLPNILNLRPLAHDEEDFAVFSTHQISKRTRFGPLQARRNRQSLVAEGRIPFKILREGEDPICLNTTDKKRCNWMVFVRPALNIEEQNLVAFQYQSNIYFVTTKDIEADTELKVWYAKEYAFSMGSRPLSKATGEEGMERDRPSRQLRPRACPRCHVKFTTPQELEAHSCTVVTMSSTPSPQHQQQDSPPARRRRARTPPPFPAPSLRGSSPRRGRPRAGEENIHTRAMQRAAEEQSTPGPSTSRASPRTHRCNVCEKTFSSPGKLYQHMYSHTGERPFACSECSKAFSSKFKLMRHLLIHSADRKHQCQFCERSFHRKDHLKNHSKVHNPDKKVYRCEKETCRKEYNSYLSYRKHVAVHAAEDGGLDCKICGKSFTNREEILYHLKVHAGSRTVKNPSEKKFQCEHCERRFFTRKDVKRHLVVHTGKRDFLCQFCPQRFGRKDHLVRHIKKSHGGRGRNKRDVPSSTVTSETSPQPSTSRMSMPGPSGTQRRASRRTTTPRQMPVATQAAPTPTPPAPAPPPLEPMPGPSREHTHEHMFTSQPPPYPDYKIFTDSSQVELGIKMEEEDDCGGGSSGMDLNQLLCLAETSSQETAGLEELDNILVDSQLMQQLMAEGTSSDVADGSEQQAQPLSQLEVSSPADSTPLPCFNQVFQQQPPPQ